MFLKVVFYPNVAFTYSNTRRDMTELKLAEYRLSHDDGLVESIIKGADVSCGTPYLVPAE